MSKLWGGRFKKKTDPDFERFSSSFKWDRKLLPYDLKIDAAYVRALQKCRVLSASEARKLLGAIKGLERQHQTGTLKLSQNSEDVHSAIQAKLSEKVGALSDKLHTGRSRNDLVSQSARLYCKDHCGRIASLISGLQSALVRKAVQTQRVLVPGMTHLQNAQPLSFAHILLAYVEMLERSKRRFLFGVDLADVCVLGSGALAGSAYRLDQKGMAKALGLSRVTDNSYDVSGDRDFILHLLSCGAFTGTQLSRMAEDLMIWQSQGFALADFDEAFCTGSSMMPQKKNADFVELVRGGAGVFIGNMIGFLTTLKGLPTSYNRDLQWDKRVLFDTVETLEAILSLLTKFFRSLEINEKRARELVSDPSLYATDLADFLVSKGVAFKEAHGQVGAIVSFAENRGLPISKIGLDLLRQFAPNLDGRVYDLFEASRSVRMKKTQGSTNPQEIRKQIKKWQKVLR